MTMTSPYPGLRPFLRDESYIFFGREEQTDELLKRLGKTSFLAVLGPSGCGKSSLVRAGMLSALETGFMASAGSRWRIAVMRPGSHPLVRLAEALIEDKALGPEQRDKKDSASFLHATLRRGPLGLIEAIRETPLPEKYNLLLLVDQFEEIFRLPKKEDKDECDAFVALLLETAAQTEVPVYIVITMRSEFLGDCARFNGLPEAMNESQYLTPRMSRDQLSEAIVAPARVFGGDVDPALLNVLLNETGTDPRNLPVLQHLLMRMWACKQPENADTELNHEVSEALFALRALGGELARTLTLEDYKKVGGFNDALSNHADEAVDSLDERQQDIAKIMFRSLCELEKDQRVNRHPTSVIKIAKQAEVDTEEVIKIVNVFRSPRYSFIVPPLTEKLYPNTTIDISHESLINLWKKLARWVKKEAKSAEMYQFIERTALRWKDGNASLWGVQDLNRARNWKKKEKPSREWAERYGDNYDLAMDFLEKSKRKWIKIFVGMLIVIVLINFLFTRSQIDKNVKVLAIADSAEKYLQVGNKEEAIKKYEEAIDIGTEHISIYITLGREYMALKSYNKAADIYREAMKIDKNNYDAYIGLGLALSKQKDYEGAKENYKKAINVDMNKIQGYVIMGDLLAAQEEFNDAIKYYNDAIKKYEEINKEFAVVQNNMGNAFLQLKNKGTIKHYKKAIEHYEKAITIDPGNIEYYISKGSALLKAGKKNEANEIYKKAIELGSEEAGIYVGLGNSLTDLGEYDKAISAYKKAIEIDEKSVTAYNGLGSVLSRQGSNDAEKYKEAAENYRESINKKPDNNTSAYLGLGSVYTKLGEFQKAVDEYNKDMLIRAVNDKAEDKPPYYYGRGNALLGMKKYGAAEESYQNAINNIGQKKSILYALTSVGKGYAFRGKGKIEEAEKIFEVAEKIFAEVRKNDKSAVQTFRERNQNIIP